jgi:hypothetical protein
MKVKLILVGMLMTVIPLVSEAQTKVKAKANQTVKTKTKTPAPSKVEEPPKEETSLKMETAASHEANVKLMPPSWALSQGYMNDRIVYFPDYYLFYTPGRGYVYWSNGQWTNSTEPPAFLQQADMRKAHAEILDNTDINAFPEKEFLKYKEQYPAEPVEFAVPIPAVR